MLESSAESPRDKWLARSSRRGRFVCRFQCANESAATAAETIVSNTERNARGMSLIERNQHSSCYMIFI